MTRLDQQQWRDLTGDLRAAANHGPQVRHEAFAAVARQAKTDVAALRNTDYVSLHDLRLLRSALQRAVGIQYETDTVVRAAFRFVAALVGLRDTLGQSFFEIKKLITQREGGVCSEDKRFLEVMTTALWCIEEQGKFSWQARHAGKPLFAAGDAEFFVGYMQHAGKRARLAKILTPEVRNSNDDWRADVSQTACDTTRALVRVASRCKESLSPKSLDSMAARLDQVVTKVEANANYTPPPEERLTITELAWVAKLGQFFDPLKPLFEHKLLTPRLQDSFEHAERLGKVHDAVQSSVVPRAPYQKGDILFSHDRKELLSRGKQTEPFRVAAQRWLTGSPYMHTGVVTGSNEAVHILGGFVRRDIKLDEASYSDYFQFDWNKLVTPEAQRKLYAAHGSYWEEEVTNRYQAQIAAATASRAGFDKLSNQQARRERSVWLPHFWRPAPPKEVRLEDKDVFCSEFVAKLVYVVLDRLEDELQAAFGSKDTSERMLKPIFSTHENFAAVHPGHLLRRLKNFGGFAEHGQLDKFLRPE